jgi:hypothetical protein
MLWIVFSEFKLSSSSIAKELTKEQVDYDHTQQGRRRGRSPESTGTDSYDLSSPIDQRSVTRGDKNNTQRQSHTLRIGVTILRDKARPKRHNLPRPLTFCSRNNFSLSCESAWQGKDQ